MDSRVRDEAGFLALAGPRVEPCGFDFATFDFAHPDSHGFAGGDVNEYVAVAPGGLDMILVGGRLGDNESLIGNAREHWPGFHQLPDVTHLLGSGEVERCLPVSS